MGSRVYLGFPVAFLLVLSLLEAIGLSYAGEEPSAAFEKLSLSEAVRKLVSGGVLMREEIGVAKLRLNSEESARGISASFPPLQSTLPNLQSPRLSMLEQSIFGSNIRVTRDSPHYYPFENEPSIVVNPANPSNIVVASHDYSDPNYIVGISVYRSFDGGKTWLGPARMVPTYGDSLSDPSLAAGRDGTIYLAYLSVGAFSEITLAISRDGGATWDTVRVLNYSTSAFYDKPWIAVGPDPSNPMRDNIYITYTEFKGYFEVNLSIKIMVSRDGGRTFEGPYNVSWEGRYPDVLVQWSYPVVDLKGILYVSFFGAKVERGVYGERVIQGIWVARSVDGGRTFSEPVLAAETHWWFPYYSGPYGFRWIVPTPATAVGSDGTIYIAYEDDPDGPEGPDMGDIFLVISRDGGMTWSKPKRINDDEGYATQFFPMIAIRKSDGSIHIAWGDKRLDPSGVGYDIYYTYSRDDGETFAKNIRVTDITVNPMYGIPFFIGDYFGMAVSDDNVYIVWTDSRRGSLAFVPGAYRDAALNQDIYIAFIGQRDRPSISITPEDIESGHSNIIAIEGRGFPREARLGISIGSMIVNKEVWSDSSGSFKIYLNIDSLPPGNISIQIFDPTNGYIIASKGISITPNSLLTAISSQIAGGFTNISAMLSSIGARLIAVENGLALVNTSLGILRLDLKSINGSIAKLDGDIAMLSTDLGVLKVRVDDLGARVVNISGDLAVVRTSVGDIVGRVSAIQGNFATVITDLGVIRARVDDNIARSMNIEARISTLEGIYIPLLLILQAVTIALLALIIFRRRAGAKPET
ncbi:MAG: sialidase family protein [Sulfolobales archaeon]